jgi:hypothetical protein
MAGKFLKPEALADFKASQAHTHAKQKREGLTQHPVRFYLCGCSDVGCAGWHSIDTHHTIPTAEECAEIIRKDNQARKRPKPPAG